MQKIVISAHGWRVLDDFYAALLSAVGAPEWHGHNLDAVWDSMNGGDINRVNPPYRFRITNLAQAPPECKALIDRFMALVSDARASGSPVEVVCEA